MAKIVVKMLGVEMDLILGPKKVVEMINQPLEVQVLAVPLIRKIQACHNRATKVLLTIININLIAKKAGRYLTQTLYQY